jgi:hypothetical protein
VLGLPETPPATTISGKIVDTDGTVLLCRHTRGAHERPSLTSPDYAKPGNRIDHFDTGMPKARALVSRPEEELHLNPNTGTDEFSLRGPYGCYVIISAPNAA